MGLLQSTAAWGSDSQRVIGTLYEGLYLAGCGLEEHSGAITRMAQMALLRLDEAKHKIECYREQPAEAAQ